MIAAVHYNRYRNMLEMWVETPQGKVVGATFPNLSITMDWQVRLSAEMINAASRLGARHIDIGGCLFPTTVVN